MQRRMIAGDRIFYIFGPPKMVEVMENICLESQCSKQNIKTENFIGVLSKPNFFMRKKGVCNDRKKITQSLNQQMSRK